MLKSEKLKLVVQQAAEKVTRYRYHYISNKIALTSLAEIEKEKGKLSSQIKKIANTYANDVFGWKGYAPWLYVYAHLAGEFKEGWIPDNYYGKVVIPKIQGDYGKVSFLKPFTNQLFHQFIGPDLAYFINGKWFSSSYELLSRDKVIKMVANLEKIIYKADYTYQGRGVFVIKDNEFDVIQLENIGNGVLQYFIPQHDFFKQFNTPAVATLRLTTAIDKNGFESLRASFLRMGRMGHTHVQSNDQILVPVDLTTGHLHEMGYFTSFKSTDKHPDSNCTFKDKIIPNFKECVQRVLALQKEMPMIQTIGWDIVVNEDNQPVIMEWNGYGSGICFSEATQGPSFKDLCWEHLHK